MGPALTDARIPPRGVHDGQLRIALRGVTRGLTKDETSFYLVMGPLSRTRALCTGQNIGNNCDYYYSTGGDERFPTLVAVSNYMPEMFERSYGY